MVRTINRIIEDESAVTMTEYAVLLAVTAALVVAAVGALSEQIVGVISTAASGLSSAR